MVSPKAAGVPKCLAAMVTQIDFSCDSPHDCQQYEGHVCGECFQATEPMPYIQTDVMLNDCPFPTTAYCINICADTYPCECEKYVTTDVMGASPTLSADQARQIEWLLSNGYPVLCAEDFFEAAGVDADDEPMLGDMDAAAVMQLVIWGIQSQPNPYFAFYECGTKKLHPKSARMARAAEVWYHKTRKHMHEPMPFLCFANTNPVAQCSRDGTIIAGPFQLEGNGEGVMDAQLDIMLEPYVPAEYVADCMGKPLEHVSLGQMFYLEFPPASRAGNCRFTLTASITGTYGLVAGLAPLRIREMPHLQPLGTAYPIRDDQVFCSTIHFHT